MFEYMFFLIIIMFCLDIRQEVFTKKDYKKLIEGATFSCNLSLRINRRYIKMEIIDCILCNLFTSKQVNLSSRNLSLRRVVCVFFPL